MANVIRDNKTRLKRRHYLLLANQASHWFNASPNVVNDYTTRYGDDFCIVLWRDGSHDDAYVLPFERLKELFTQENLVGGTGGYLRWHGSVDGGHLALRDTNTRVFVGDCYNAFHFLQP